MTAEIDFPIQALLRFFSKTKGSWKPKSKMLVACSGGPDSVALVWSLRSLAFELPFDFQIGHVNHMLRGKASQQDARFVRALARQVGWPFRVTHRPVRPLSYGNLEEVAREKRYEALAQMAQKSGCTTILTAHTLDDQVETVLMNLLRGTGPDGLAGIRPMRSLGKSTICLCRPFLGVSKAELLNWLNRFKFQFRSDRSNKNENFFRNWLRRRLLPQLELKAPGLKERISRLATIAGDEKEYWDDFMKSLEPKLLKNYRGGRLLDLGGLLSYPPAVQRRFLRRVLGGDLLAFDAVERARAWMESAPTSGRLFQFRRGWTIERLSKSQGSPSAQLFWFKTSPVKKDKHLA